MEKDRNTRITNEQCLGFSLIAAASIAGGLAIAIIMFAMADQLIQIVGAI